MDDSMQMGENFNYLEYIESTSMEERIKLCSVYYEIHPRCRMQGLRLFKSLKTNYFCIVRSYDNIQNNFSKVIENYIEVEGRGYASNIPNEKLLCMVRHFFSDIYSFLDIYGIIYSSLLSPKGKPLPPRFNNQRKMVLNDPNINDFMDYSKVLGDLTWYEKFHILRSEETHFLLGTISVDKNEGNYSITYSSRTDSLRNGRIDKMIKIDDVLLFISQIIAGVNKLFDHISVEILKSIDPNKRCHISFGVEDGSLCVKGLSIIESILNKPGECAIWQGGCSKHGKICFAEIRQ